MLASHGYVVAALDHSEVCSSRGMGRQGLKELNYFAYQS
jgi:hypothetical protein